MKLDLHAVRSYVAYDSNTGQFTCIASGMNRRIGRALGSINKTNGYVEVGVLGKRVSGHRLAWALAHGEWPALAIDHINGIRHDNRIANLRLATGSLNSENVRRASRNNTSGFLGVTYCHQTKRWVAQICVNGKHKNLGRFDTPEIAHQAYVKAKRQLHAGCTL